MSAGVRVAVVEKRYSDDGEPVLRDLELAVAPGEFVALIGPSGCGKSTLLRLIAGLDASFVGEVHTDRRSAPGMVFQAPRLLPWMSVLANVALVIGDDLARARDWLARVQLDDRGAAYPRELSGGMQRRVALARAFAVESPLLLLDEPFVSLDQPTADDLRALLLALWSASRPTVILVTHDLTEALLLADRVVFLSPSPTTVIHELGIDAARPRARHDQRLATIAATLVARYPSILSGRTDPETSL